MKRIIGTITKAYCLSFFCMAIFSGVGINTAYAHCKGKHADYEPHCGGTEPPPDPDPSGPVDPQVVYRDGGIYLADDDGTGKVLIRSGGVGPKLDAINNRVLFFDYPNLGNINYLAFIPFSFDTDGFIVIEPEVVPPLVSSGAQLGGKLSSEGVSDWSPDGTKYSYSYRTQAVPPDGPWVHRMVVAPDPVEFPEGAHTEVYASEEDGGLNSATWDASGDFIYHQDTPLDGSFQNGLFVIDVSTSPGNTVATLELGPIFVDAGFSAESNVQQISASYEIGGDYSIGGAPGAYSFDSGNELYPASSDTSLCLMLSVIDWSLNRNNRFIVIIDLPKHFDSGASGDGLSCSIATNGSAIRNFAGTDLTTDDVGIVGQDTSKNRVRGVWVYDIGSGSRTKIIGDGGFPDWSN
jgi:hypothetical protein